MYYVRVKRIGTGHLCTSHSNTSCRQTPLDTYGMAVHYARVLNVPMPFKVQTPGLRFTNEGALLSNAAGLRWLPLPYTC